MEKWLPTFITFVPLVFTLIIVFMPKHKELAIKTTALIGAFIALIGSIYLYFAYDFSRGGFQFVVKKPWIDAVGAKYYMAIDGVSLPLILVTTLLTFICIIASWNVKNRVKEYMALMIFIEVGMIGIFLALDFILFYVFWEIVLVPMYFLIGIWGGPRKEYAAIKFFLYTFLGSIFMLLGILAIYFYSGMGTFDMMRLAHAKLPTLVAKLAFLGMFIGFAIKVPMFPFHTWLPDAHVEAPTTASVLLAGVLLKMGTYAFVRIGLQVIYAGMKPFLMLIAILSVISIIYGAFCAMVQKDLKKLVAYSSVSHMGYVMLGVTSLTVTGINGAILQMFNHGIITGMLFLLVGLIHERYHTREIEKLGGLLVTMGIIASVWVYTSFASLGLPSLAGFIGEFLVLTGSFPVYRALTALAALAVVLTAGYFLWTIQRICLGQPKIEGEVLDATPRELSYMVPLMLTILIIGVYPAPILNVIKPTVMQIVSSLGGI